MVALSVATVALFPAPSRAAATLEQTLTARDGKAKDSFGVSVAISDDTAVVGAPNEGGGGVAYVFTRSDGTWTERATLKAPVRAVGGKFGFEVAIDGDTIVVGAPQVDEKTAGPGAAHVFVRSGDAWPLEKTLTASDGENGDAFGSEVAVSGDTVVAGAPTDDVRAPGDNQGSAYVFTRTGGVWSEQRLTARDGTEGDEFGQSVAVSGDRVVAGAWRDDVDLSLDEGSAYVFTRAGATWTEQAKLTAADGLAQARFGVAVAISHGMIVVGAIIGDLKGSAYVFEPSAGSWTQQAKLTAPDGFPVDQFGRAVAVAKDTVVVGAHYRGADHPNPYGRGAAYIFARQGAGWAEPTMLTEPGTRIFGNSVGISGHTIIAGAGFTQVGENVEQGAAYVYRLRPPKHAPTSDGGDSSRDAEATSRGVGRSGGDATRGRPSPAGILPETR